jgi:dTDP-4-dehydrorhamnose reductase
MSQQRVDLFIVGASGQVGGALREAAAERPMALAARWPSEPGWHQINLEEMARDVVVAARLLDATRPTVVVNCAGFTNVEACEEDPERALAINARAAGALAAASASAGARSVYLSTEYVFDGVGGPYGEDDAPHPISVYGRSKLEGERAVLAADPRALVVRTTVVYGPEERGKNFAYQVAGALEEGRRIRVPSDQVSSPTYCRDLAAAILALVDLGGKGIVNVVGPERLSRIAFGRRLAACLGGDANLLTSVATADLGQTAPRPLDAGLRTDRLRGVLPALSMRGVESSAMHWRSHQRGRPWGGH